MNNIKIISYREFDKFKNNLFTFNKDIELKVDNIIKNIREDGDNSLIQYCNNFDKNNFKSSNDFLVTKEEIENAYQNVDRDFIEALKISYDRIFDFHKRQVPKDLSYIDDKGTRLGNKWKVIESIMAYVPGGSASYPSSVLMNVIPALVCNVKDISISTPAYKGKIDPRVLVAAKICNIQKIYKIGGAFAISAFAIGTESIKKVNKIVGPGNQFVTLAKRKLFGEVGIDMLAGPTDILIICDNEVDPNWIASDLLSQLEHGPDSSAILITNDRNYANLVNESLFKLLKTLERRDIINQSIKNCFFVIVDSLEDQAAEIANIISPEHLEIISEKYQEVIFNQITNAGAVFLGKYSPEAIGDYLAGPSHTLPTSGTAKFSSALSVYDFLKRISVISCNKDSFEYLSKYCKVLAENEGLNAHKLSIDIRLKNNSSK